MYYKNPSDLCILYHPSEQIMVSHRGKNMATILLILLFGAMAFTAPSRADLHPNEGASSMSEDEGNKELTSLRWWRRKSPPPPGKPHFPPVPSGSKTPPKPPGRWRPWRKSPPGADPPKPWWKRPWRRRKSPPPLF
ncbi:UNVERIFIED_CONTAM: hypothetical protein Sindi_1601500 [Sesamum indicum]